MHALPHTYRVSAAGADSGQVTLASPGLPHLVTAPPAEFGGPGDVWSPETLLVGAVADCFVLTFRAVARAGKLEWVSLGVEVDGVLDRDGGVLKFTRITLRPTLVVARAEDRERATAMLEKSERSCLISNSLTATLTLEPEVRAAA